jgi:hypothetical protein
MTMVRLIKRCVLGVVVAGALVGLVGVVPAYGLSPWWHLSSASRPTYLQPGQGKDEVQQLTVSGTEGLYLAEDGASKTILYVGESPKEVQRALEGYEALEGEMYGPGNVEVTGGPGPGGYNPYEVYEIKFVGKLADQVVTLMEHKHNVIRGEELVEPTVQELVNGRPDGVIVVSAVNLGDADADVQVQPITVKDVLPPGLVAVGIEGTVDEENVGDAGDLATQLECSLGSLSCVLTEKTVVTDTDRYVFGVPPYRHVEMRIGVNLVGTKSGEVNEASVTGGGAPAESARQPLRMIAANAAPPSFGVNTYEVRPEEEGGGAATQAGSHPFQLTTTLGFNETFEGKPLALTKDLHFKLPPGLIGDPTPFAQCSLTEFLQREGPACSAQTVVGIARVTINLDYHGSEVKAGEETNVFQFVMPLFNMEPAIGEPARFGFIVNEGGFFAPEVPVLLDTAVRTGGDYGVTVNVTNISQEAEFVGSEVTFWGVPGDERHDNARGADCLENAFDAALPIGAPPFIECPSFVSPHSPPPLLALPTSCTGALQTSVEADSWEEPHDVLPFSSTEPMPALDGCNRLQFDPSIEVAPDGQAGSTPTGLAVSVHVPQAVSLDAEGLAEADVRNTSVALPEGVAINPAGADGLQACSEEQIALKSDEPPLCPEASKVGLVKIKTPLLPNSLEGAAYLASQDANPFGSLVALYVYAEDPVSGARVKVAGEVVPNPITGQLVSTFKDTPQLPFETFEIHFFGGDRAPLATPAYCGAYTTGASIEPWTGTGAVDSSSTFDITSGPATFSEPNGSPCPGVRLPFDPSLTGGATNIDAGAFSPFSLTMTRKDGEQNLQSVQAILPPGLSGILSNVELCPEPQANLGECGPGSLIGETTVSVGVGGDPFSVAGGRFYLTGPYNGSGGCTVGSPGCAPFGITFEVPAKAGPYDLKRNTANPAGEDPCDCVIVRAKIEVNPITAAITITSDPPGSPYAIPTSIEGIPLEIQHVNAITTRNDFQFNPTNCEKMEVSGTIHSSEGATDTIGVPFQVTNCAILAFKPGFKVSTAGKTSRAGGASLNVKLTYPKAPFGTQANIKSVKVDLPKQLPSRLTTLQKACTAKQFESNPAGCPPESIVGHATAITPLIPVPLTGPAYFVSYGGAKFPELVIVLQGYNVTLDLHGETFISKAGITSSTFHTVPDAPVGSFELNLPQGKYSALAANGNLCKSKLVMPTLFDAQNGMTIKQSTPITVTGCPKKATKAKRSSRRHKGKPHGKK